MALDPDLHQALEVMCADPSQWVHVATVTPDGGPHVTPMLLGRDDEHLYLSLTGKRKRANLRARPEVCISISRAGDMGHVVVWGDVELRTDDWAQQRWERMIRTWGGDAMLERMATRLSEETTVLGVVTPRRWRIFQVPGLEPAT